MRVDDQDFQMALSHTYIGFNRPNFMHGIFHPHFDGSYRKCAEALGLKPNYLRDILTNPERGAGTKTLSKVYQYCIRNKIDPNPYIFVLK